MVCLIYAIHPKPTEGVYIRQTTSAHDVTTISCRKDVKSNGWPVPPDFDRFENFGHGELTAKHCYFRCSRPPDIDGIKMFDKDYQSAKH